MTKKRAASSTKLGKPAQPAQPPQQRRRTAIQGITLNSSAHCYVWQKNREKKSCRNFRSRCWMLSHDFWILMKLNWRDCVRVAAAQVFRPPGRMQDLRGAAPQVNTARGRVGKPPLKGIFWINGHRIYKTNTYGCGSKWKTKMGPQMWMSSLVLTIHNFGVPNFDPYPYLFTGFEITAQNLKQLDVAIDMRISMVQMDQYVNAGLAEAKDLRQVVQDAIEAVQNERAASGAEELRLGFRSQWKRGRTPTAHDLGRAFQSSQKVYKWTAFNLPMTAFVSHFICLMELRPSVPIARISRRLCKSWKSSVPCNNEGIRPCDEMQRRDLEATTAFFVQSIGCADSVI